MSGRSRQTAVSGYEGGFERLAEGDENRVVRGDVRSQFPDPFGEWQVRISDDVQIREVGPSILGSIGGEIPAPNEPPENVEKLNIDEMGSVEVAVLGKSGS